MLSLVSIMNMNDTLKAECNLKIYVRNEACNIFENILAQSLHYCIFYALFNMLEKIWAINWWLPEKNKHESGCKIKAERQVPPTFFTVAVMTTELSRLLCFKLSPSALPKTCLSSKHIPSQEHTWPHWAAGATASTPEHPLPVLPSSL